MNTAREEVLAYGLIDWVDLGRIHWYVTEENPSASAVEVQNQTLALIRSLLSEGLYEVGDLSGKGGQFVGWDLPLDEAMQRIHDMYVTRYDDNDFWSWGCWLELTRNGVRAARGVKGVGSVREDILLTGLCGSVSLRRVHRYVQQDIPDAPVPEVQNDTLSLVRSLLNDGLFEVGDFSDTTKSFTFWGRPVDESMRRIADLYVLNFDDRLAWQYEVWLKLTDKGIPVARAVEEKAKKSRPHLPDDEGTSS